MSVLSLEGLLSDIRQSVLQSQDVRHLAAFDALVADARRWRDQQAFPRPDWRVGLTCKAKLRGHVRYYERGTIRAVLPSGTDGIVDPAGVLKIETMAGEVFLAPADEWMTA